MPSLLEDPIKFAYQTFAPIFTTLEITQVCNLKCKHCYNYDRSLLLPAETKKNSLSSARILRLIEEIAEAKGLYLNFSGGEALLHPDLLEFIQKACSVNLLPRLKSNAILLTSTIQDSLYEAGLNCLDISLYGASEKTYFDFTGRADVFQKIKENLKNIDLAKFDVNMGIILHRSNVAEIDQMVELCNELGLPFQFSIEITERYDGSKGSRTHEITDEQFKSLLSGPYGQSFMCKNEDEAKQCSCARSVCGISTTGEVFPCIGAPLLAGNIKSDSFQSIWKNSPVLNRIRGLKDQDFEACQSCDFIKTCARSSGGIYLNTGNYTGCEERILSQAKIRSQIQDTL
jgi:radical SAM protein with 4Fe4S-binding SPASM domain